MNTILNEYTDFGGNYEVIHHTELIEELIEIVRYSIPHLSKLNSKDNYNQLSSLYRNMNIDNYVNIKTSDIEKSIYLAKNC